MYFHQRKSTRLVAQNYLGYQFYFLTLCCFERRKVFVDVTHCEMVLGILNKECVQRKFAGHAYCLMPDHIHLLCEGLDPTSDFLRLVMSFRIKTSRRFAQNPGRVLWQRSYYDHIPRAREEVETVAWYIWLNPVRKQLVSKPQEYRFAGSFTGWKLPSSWDAPQWMPPWKENVGSSF
jgi:putative transposase